MKSLSRYFGPLIGLCLCACSVYQSDGRKFLEKQAFEYTGAQAYLRACSANVSDPALLLLEQRDRAEVFLLPEPGAVRVSTRAPQSYSCDYGFTSESERYQHLDSAIELTLRLGEFANRQIYLLE